MGRVLGKLKASFLGWRADPTWPAPPASGTALGGCHALCAASKGRRRQEWLLFQSPPARWRQAPQLGALSGSLVLECFVSRSPLKK